MSAFDGGEANGADQLPVQLDRDPAESQGTTCMSATSRPRSLGQYTVQVGFPWLLKNRQLVEIARWDTSLLCKYREAVGSTAGGQVTVWNLRSSPSTLRNPTVVR